MSLLLSELALRHEGVVRRTGSAPVGGSTPSTATAVFMGESNLLDLLSDLVLHLPACATSIHR